MKFFTTLFATLAIASISVQPVEAQTTSSYTTTAREHYNLIFTTNATRSDIIVGCYGHNDYQVYSVLKTTPLTVNLNGCTQGVHLQPWKVPDTRYVQLESTSSKTVHTKGFTYTAALSGCKAFDTKSQKLYTFSEGKFSFVRTSNLLQYWIPD